MFQKRLTGKTNRFGNSVTCYLAAPLFFERLPGQAISDLFEYLPDHDPRAAKCGLAVAYLGVGYDKTGDHFPDSFNRSRSSRMSRGYSTTICIWCGSPT